MVYRAVLGPRHGLVADLLNNLGLAARELGRYTEAREWYLQALDAYRAEEDADHHSTTGVVVSRCPLS